ncbi:MAG: hypothetical protein BRC56_00215, partial [Cyanobacteria bacterium SW_9_47_5]
MAESQENSNPFAEGNGSSGGSSIGGSGGGSSVGGPSGGSSVGGNIPALAGDGTPSFIGEAPSTDSAGGINNETNGNGNWYLAGENQTEGNGNWYFASGNETTGNGNWYLGSDNATTGNA